ncbi:MAG: DUF1127 domain-containing protein, partial [Marinomonas sp.]
MAALNYAPSARGPLGLLHSLAGALRGFASWALAKREDTRTRHLLMSLNDRELADIGLTRCEIDRIICN